ncbi:MAG TPA: HDOD domain-containing protein [Nitrospirota bacterium]|nr:HDOD domain-containing protein [Nitrospirota bacterium]
MPIKTKGGEDSFGKPMTNSDVRHFIKQLQDLSTTPAMLGKILSMAGDETKSTKDLGELISYDPAMAQRVLKIANSALFAHSGMIKDIHQAVFFLGLNMIKSIVVGMTVMNIFPPTGTFRVENLWLHSYEVAFLSSVLTEKIAITNNRESFLAGLLHDIGRMVFYSLDHASFQSIETTDTMLEQETTVFGCTHAEAGAWFAADIGLPDSIVLSIKHHHKPSASPDEMNLVSLVSLAEAFARMLNPRVEDDGIWTQEHNAILLEFSLTHEDIHAIDDRFRSVRNDIEKFFAS